MRENSVKNRRMQGYIITKKERSINFSLWVDSGTRTHDIQNHNLTL